MKNPRRTLLERWVVTTLGLSLLIPLLTISPASATLASGDITVDDVTVPEGNAGQTSIVFTITLEGTNALGGLVVGYATSDGTAKAGPDYTTTSGSVTFAAGQLSKTVTVPITTDAQAEPDETFTVTITKLSDDPATITDPTGTGTIVNDDGDPPAIAIADASIAEGDTGTAGVTVPVTLSPASTLPVTVDYTTAAGSATAGSDFTSTSGTLTFAPSSTSQDIVVPIVGDETDETDESFTIVISSPDNAVLSDATATVTIEDDDHATVSISDSDDVVEGATGSTTTMSFEVTMSAPSAVEVVVGYATTTSGTASAGDDFTATSGTITFPPGETTETIEVDVLGDDVLEPDETVEVALWDEKNAIIAEGGGSATGLIVDDELATLAVDDVTVGEGETANFTVSLSHVRSHDVMFDVDTADGTATAGSDFSGMSTTGTIPAGSTSVIVSTSVLDDAVAEDTESFGLVLSSPIGAGISDDVGTATVEDDDSVDLAIVDVSKAEGDAGTTTFSFAISLDGQHDNTIAVGFTTGDASASAGEDYTASSGTVIFAPGDNAETVTIDVLGDVVKEGDETFVVDLTVPDSVGTADLQAVGTILDDDDSAPTVSISDGGAIWEGNSGTRTVTFTVALSAPSEKSITVRVRTADFTASAGSDYQAVSTTLTFAPGTTSRTVSVIVYGDRAKEADEFLVAELSNPTNATIGREAGFAKIVDDDRSADERWVEWLVLDFLGREIHDGDPIVAQFTGMLQQGSSRREVAQQLAYSDFYLSALVDSLYLSTLGRHADKQGKQYWLHQLRAGLSPAAAATYFYAGAEYYQRSGGTHRAWVADLYREILGRNAQSSELDYWVGVMRDGAGRDVVAWSFVNSIESRRSRVTFLYRYLLGRFPDRAGREYWAEILKNGRDVDLAVELAVSQEYYNLSQRYDARWFRFE